MYPINIHCFFSNVHKPESIFKYILLHFKLYEGIFVYQFNGFSLLGGKATNLIGNNKKKSLYIEQNFQNVFFGFWYISSLSLYYLIVLRIGYVCRFKGREA